MNISIRVKSKISSYVLNKNIYRIISSYLNLNMFCYSSGVVDTFRMANFCRRRLRNLLSNNLIDSKTVQIIIHKIQIHNFTNGEVVVVLV